MARQQTPSPSATLAIAASIALLVIFDLGKPDSPLTPFGAELLWHSHNKNEGSSTPLPYGRISNDQPEGAWRRRGPSADQRFIPSEQEPPHQRSPDWATPLVPVPPSSPVIYLPPEQFAASPGYRGSSSSESVAGF